MARNLHLMLDSVKVASCVGLVLFFGFIKRCMSVAGGSAINSFTNLSKHGLVRRQARGRELALLPRQDRVQVVDGLR